MLTPRTGRDLQSRLSLPWSPMVMAEETTVLQQASTGILACNRQYAERLPLTVRVIDALVLRRLLNTETCSYTSGAYYWLNCSQ